MPSARETGLKTLYRLDGSDSGNYPRDLLAEDRKALRPKDFKEISEGPRTTIIFLGELAKPDEEFVRQIEAQAAIKAS